MCNTTVYDLHCHHRVTNYLPVGTVLHPKNPEPSCDPSNGSLYNEYYVTPSYSTILTTVTCFVPIHY